MASESYALGPYKIDPTEVFYSTQLSYAMVNLSPVVPGIKKGDVEAADQEEGIEVAWNQVKLDKLSDDSGDLRGVYSEVKLLKRDIYCITVDATAINALWNYDRAATDYDRDATDYDRDATDCDRDATDYDRDTMDNDRDATDNDRNTTDYDRDTTDYERDATNYKYPV
ncbi:hypothetical protein QQ045_002544 [Rhodiola kirilowii]